MLAGPKHRRLQPHQTTLDLKLARQIVADKFLEAPGPQSTADLRPFSSIKPEAIEYLRQFPYTWVDFGINHLIPALAKEIAAWNAEAFSFKDGMETNAEALTCFHRCPASLRFGNISDAFDLRAAQALSQSAPFLEFTLEELVPEIAEQVAMHHGWLELRIKQPVSPDAMAKLARHQGDQCQVGLNQPLTGALLSALLDATGKRVLDIGGKRIPYGYENILLICSPARYSEIMSFLDLPGAMDRGPIR